MTLRDRICAAGVTTLREYTCVETGEKIYVPTDRIEVNIEETSILVDLEESDVITSYVNVHTAYK